MNKTYEKKNIELTVRMNETQHNMLKKCASQYGISRSNYLLNLFLKSNDKTKRNHQVKRLTKNDLRDLIRSVSIIYDLINQCRLDYARAFANLEHDNDLFNHGRLPTIRQQTLKQAFLGVLANRKQLHDILRSLNEMEATLYDR